MENRHYEEIIGADPSVDVDALGLSPEEREKALAFRDEMLALDEKIAAALDIDTPEPALPAMPSIDGGDVADLASRTKPRVSGPAWIAMAASVALVAVFAWRAMGPAEFPSLAAEVVAHLDHEPGALHITSTPVAERSLDGVVNQSGVSVDGGLGLVTYARSCVINGKTVPHLVIQGEAGPVTLLLMPGEKIDGAVPLEGESINGVILPVGDGSIAIIGERDENLDVIEEQVVDAVRFNI